MFWVSKLGPDAIATVGLTESMLIIVYAFAMGLSIGAAAMVARRIGEKDPRGRIARRGAGDRARRGAGRGGRRRRRRVRRRSCWPRWARPPEVVAIGGRFTRVMLGGNVTVVLLFLINAAFRGAGRAAIAMRALWLANGINIVLGPVLMFGLGPFPRLGVTGAAIATTIGRGVGVAVPALRAARGTRPPGGAARTPARSTAASSRRSCGSRARGIFQIFIGHDELGRH